MAERPAIAKILVSESGIPNSRLPLLFWKARLPVPAHQGDAAAALWRSNGWQGTWVHTVYPFWHFHTRGHEVLGCVSGRARIGFGGDGGIVAEMEPGDVCIIPAGVAHRRLDASADFAVAGAYPPGQQGDIVRPGGIDVGKAAARIAQLALPATDPVSGRTDGVVEHWASA